jgi:hypothetical protein
MIASDKKFVKSIYPKAIAYNVPAQWSGGNRVILSDPENWKYLSDFKIFECNAWTDAAIKIRKEMLRQLEQ